MHPDRGGDHDLFIWTRSLREHVAGDGIEPVVDDRPRRARHPRTAERVPFEVAFDRASGFDELTACDLIIALDLEEIYASLLRFLLDCREVTETDGYLCRQQRQDATYRSLAAIAFAYAAGMNKEERTRWYRIAECIPLSQRHAGHILSRLQRRAA